MRKMSARNRLGVETDAPPRRRCSTVYSDIACSLSASFDPLNLAGGRPAVSRKLVKSRTSRKGGPFPSFSTEFPIISTLSRSFLCSSRRSSYRYSRVSNNKGYNARDRAVLSRRAPRTLTNICSSRMLVLLSEINRRDNVRFCNAGFTATAKALPRNRACAIIMSDVSASDRRIRDN